MLPEVLPAWMLPGVGIIPNLTQHTSIIAHSAKLLPGQPFAAIQSWVVVGPICCQMQHGTLPYRGLSGAPITLQGVTQIVSHLVFQASVNFIHINNTVQRWDFWGEMLLYALTELSTSC